MYNRIKRRVFEILESKFSNKSARLFTVFIITLIILNVIAVILETVEPVFDRYTQLFIAFEIFSVVVFSIEYLLRIWACNSDEKYPGKVKGRIKYALTPLALIDLMAILPFYLPVLLKLDLRFVRALRLIRFTRVFKIGRYSDALYIVGRAIKSKKEELIISVIIVFILLVLASSAMYYVENEAQPDAFSSIPHAMWWGVATLTTVGYGDIYPVTALGRVLGGMIALLGIAMFALPTGIISSAFTEEIQKKWTKKNLCPHCGKDISPRINK